MGDAPKCAGRSKRSGRPCGKLGLRKPDGSFTTGCRFHGGVQQLAAPGDPIRGGRPPEHGLFREVLKTDQERADFDRVRAQLGKLDDEVTLARTFFAAYLRTRQTTDAGRGEHLERIARLENRRVRLLADLQDLDEPPPPPPGAGGLDESDPEVIDDARQRLRDKLLRDGD